VLSSWFLKVPPNGSDAGLKSMDWLNDYEEQKIAEKVLQAQQGQVAIEVA